ncbi:MAG: GNAT family N-acetyltransferase [Chloroflexota bacterium]
MTSEVQSQAMIRQLRADDLPALEWGGEYRHFRRLYREIYQGACMGRAVMWVAELPPAGVIGQVFVQLDSARKELADGAIRAYIYGFRIQALYRSQGLGGRMLATVEGDLQRRRFYWATLNVARENPDARRFYERHGYQVVADEPGRWYYMDDDNLRHDVHEPAWRMEKRIKD